MNNQKKSSSRLGAIFGPIAVVLIFILLSSESVQGMLAEALFGGLPDWLLLAIIPAVPLGIAILIYLSSRNYD